MGLILHKSFNDKAFSAAKGGALCKEEAAFSGRFMQNPSGRAYFGAFSEEIRLEGDKPTAPNFSNKSLKICSVKPVSMFVDRS